MFSYLFPIVFAVTILFQTKTSAQKTRQEIGLAVYNCGLGGLTSGIGALINKKKNEKGLAVFLRGFTYGSIGGLINYSGKKIAYLVSYSKDSVTNKDNFSALLWGWPAKIVHAAGSSIMENAAANKEKIFSDYNIPVGFINVSVRIKKQITVSPQLMPNSFLDFITHTIRAGSRLQFRESILSGTPYFLADDNTPYLEGYSAVANANCIVMKSNFAASSKAGFFRAHEYIHILQQREYYVFNQYFNKPLKGIINEENKSIRFIKKYIYADVPYISFFYNLMQQPADSYYRNIFELEAEHFATNSFITR
jgi:hypothetical protein